VAYFLGHPVYVLYAALYAEYGGNSQNWSACAYASAIIIILVYI